jgi:putative transposase
VVRPSRRREMAKRVVAERGISIRLACLIFSVSQTCYRYEAKNNAENEQMADWLLRLTDNHRNWRFGLCYLYLRNIKGLKWNHKRIYRIYKALELSLRIKPRKRLNREKPEPLAVPQEINQVWSMDFMHDQLSDGRTFRVLNLIDGYNREALGMKIDFSLPSKRVIRALKQIIEWRDRPLVIRCDNGPENVSGAIQNWAEEAGIAFQYIQPGKPQQNAYVERFNRTVRYEWLSQHYWKAWMKHQIQQPAGSGPTIMNTQTWPWAASYQDSGWPWPLNLCFRSPIKREDYSSMPDFTNTSMALFTGGGK